MDKTTMIDNVMAKYPTANRERVASIIDAGFNNLAGVELGRTDSQLVEVDFMGIYVQVTNLKTGEIKRYDDDATKAGALMTHAANDAIARQTYSTGGMR